MTSKQYNEFFFVIDNTDFPLFKTEYLNPSRKEVFADVTFTTEFNGSSEYQELIIFVGCAAVALFLLLIVMIVLYKKEKNVYMRLA